MGRKRPVRLGYQQPVSVASGNAFNSHGPCPPLPAPLPSSLIPPGRHHFIPRHLTLTTGALPSFLYRDCGSHVPEKSIFGPMLDANRSQVKECHLAFVWGPRLRIRLPTQAQVGAETDHYPSAIPARGVPARRRGVVKNKKCVPTSGSRLHPLPRTLTSRKKATQD